MAQLMPLPLTVSCFSKIQIGFTFLVPAHPGSPGKRAVKRVCKRVCVVWRFCTCLVVCFLCLYWVQFLIIYTLTWLAAIVVGLLMPLVSRSVRARDAVRSLTPTLSLLCILQPTKTSSCSTKSAQCVMLNFPLKCLKTTLWYMWTSTLINCHQSLLNWLFRYCVRALVNVKWLLAPVLVKIHYCFYGMLSSHEYKSLFLSM